MITAAQSMAQSVTITATIHRSPWSARVSRKRRAGGEATRAASPAWLVDAPSTVVVKCDESFPTPGRRAGARTAVSWTTALLAEPLA
jgi:hypothetical protein